MTGDTVVAETGTVIFFVHAEGRPAKAVRALATDSVAEIVGRAGVQLTPGLNIFLGECVDALREPHEIDDGDDSHAPLGDHQHSPHSQGHHVGGHIHCHRCHRVRVVVTYNGQDKRHRFSPATTVETVRLWAIKKFRLSDVDAETLILMVCGVAKPPQVTAHLGELLAAESDQLHFELVPDQRING